MSTFNTHVLPDDWFNHTEFDVLTVIDARGNLFATNNPGVIIAAPAIEYPVNGLSGLHDPDFVGRHRLYEDFHNNDDVRFLSDNGDLYHVAKIWNPQGAPVASSLRAIVVGPRWERV